MHYNQPIRNSESEQSSPKVSLAWGSTWPGCQFDQSDSNQSINQLLTGLINWLCFLALILSITSGNIYGKVRILQRYIEGWTWSLIQLRAYANWIRMKNHLQCPLGQVTGAGKIIILCVHTFRDIISHITLWTVLFHFGPVHWSGIFLMGPVHCLGIFSGQSLVGIY